MKKQRQRRKLKLKTDRPILMVNKTNKHIYAQLVNQKNGKIIATSSDFDIKTKPKASKDKTKNVALAEKIGEKVAKLAKKKKINKIVFDRSGYPYQGIVAAIAEGARKGGLEF